jgi:hypothetical protein
VLVWLLPCLVVKELHAFALVLTFVSSEENTFFFRYNWS